MRACTVEGKNSAKVYITIIIVIAFNHKQHASTAVHEGALTQLRSTQLHVHFSFKTCLLASGSFKIKLQIFNGPFTTMNRIVFFLISKKDHD